MSYLRRIVAKSRNTPPRIVARALPTFSDVETPFEELDDEVLLPMRPTDVITPASPVGLLPSERQAPDVPSDVTPHSAELTETTDNAASTRPPSPSHRLLAEEPKRAWLRIQREARVIARRQRAAKTPGVEDASPAREDVPLLPADGDAAAPRRVVGLRAPPALPDAKNRSRREVPPGEVRSETTVNVAIGRIEVRAATAEPPKESRPKPFRPRLSLEDYLARRGDVAR